MFITEDLKLKSIPVGLQIPEINTILINSKNKKCGINETGKAYVYGVQVSKGYWNNKFLNNKYFVENFNDDEKSPLSYFWLGEIALIENNLDISNSYFLELVSIYPSHYRTPLAHKKIGDIFLKKNELDKAKDKYNYVIREYPNDTASSLALQLLKNME